MNKAFHKAKQPKTKTNLFLPWKKIQFQIKLANPSRILKFSVLPNQFQTKTNMLVANHQVTHLHLATIFRSKCCFVNLVA